MIDKEPKPIAHYVAVGTPAAHCGRVVGWPKGECVHYEAPNACAIVEGKILERASCKHWLPIQK